MKKLMFVIVALCIFLLPLSACGSEQDYSSVNEYESSTQPDDSEGISEQEVPGELANYLGEWENDTFFCILEINSDGINMYEGNGYNVESYTLTDEGNLELSYGALIQADDSGGLTLNGYDGVFYPKGEKECVCAPYIGEWYNDKNGETLTMMEGGNYIYKTKDGDFGGSDWWVSGKGELEIGGYNAYVDENGNIVRENREGVYVKEAS